MANVQVFQRHAHLAGAVKLEFVNGREGKIAKGVLTAISNTRRGSGDSAADVPPSAATGAAVEPLRALQRIRSSAARLRAWRVTGVAIWPAPHRAERSAATCKPVSSPSGPRSRVV